MKVVCYDVRVADVLEGVVGGSAYHGKRSAEFVCDVVEEISAFSVMTAQYIITKASHSV